MPTIYTHRVEIKLCLLVFRDVVEGATVEDVLAEHDTGVGVKLWLVVASVGAVGDVSMLFVDSKTDFKAK